MMQTIKQANAIKLKRLFFRFSQLQTETGYCKRLVVLLEPNSCPNLLGYFLSLCFPKNPASLHHKAQRRSPHESHQTTVPLFHQIAGFDSAINGRIPRWPYHSRWLTTRRFWSFEPLDAGVDNSRTPNKRGAISGPYSDRTKQKLDDSP